MCLASQCMTADKDGGISHIGSWSKLPGAATFNKDAFVRDCSDAAIISCTKPPARTTSNACCFKKLEMLSKATAQPAGHCAASLSPRS